MNKINYMCSNFYFFMLAYYINYIHKLTHIRLLQSLTVAGSAQSNALIMGLDSCHVYITRAPEATQKCAEASKTHLCYKM